MKERPILFSGPMVRAILEGRKTVTRRVAKFKPREAGYNLAFSGLDAGNYCTGVMKSGFVLRSRGGPSGCWNDRTWPIHCPYGLPGDRLWVRETWSDVNLQGAPGIAYRADDDVRDLMEDESFLDERGAFNYGDPRCKAYHFACWSEDLLAGTEGRWRPSIHMPRWVSRILLEITAVRVEQLQDITEEQAVVEGVDRPENIRDVDVWDGAERELFNAMNQPRDRFKRLWADINGAESWDANPWVWVVEFKRVEAASV
ncbi:MAG: hypothetical protein AB1459_17660 [Pseudomonadota bacterium]